MKRDDELTRREAAKRLGVTKGTIIYHERRGRLKARFDEDERQWVHDRAAVDALARLTRAHSARSDDGEEHTEADDVIDLEIFRRLDRGENGVAIALALGVAPRRVAKTIELFQAMLHTGTNATAANLNAVAASYAPTAAPEITPSVTLDFETPNRDDPDAELLKITEEAVPRITPDFTPEGDGE